MSYKYVSQADMDYLAALANSKLLPAVNAQPLWSYLVNPYDKFNGTAYDLTPDFISPQPPYSFTPAAYVNLVPDGTMYNESGNYSLALPISADYNFTLGQNDAGFKVGSMDYLYSTSNIYFRAATMVQLNGSPGEPVTMLVYVSPFNWLSELNRIRSDAYQMLSQPAFSSPLLNSPVALCSGPWVVGVNDPATYPLTEVHADFWAGVLDGAGNVLFNGYPSPPVADNVLTIPGMKEVSFVSTGMLGGFSIDTMRRVVFDLGPEPATINFTQSGTATQKVRYIIPFNYTGAGSPDLSGFTFSTSRTTTWSIVTSLGSYFLIGTSSDSISTDGSFTYSIITGANYTFTGYGGMVLDAVFATALVADAVAVNGVHPTLPTKALACSDLPDSDTLTVNGLPSTVAWKISDSMVNGIWLAITLPVPGMNVFIDQDMPPYIGATTQIGTAVPGLIDVGCAGNNGAGGQYTQRTDAGIPVASTMRQMAPILSGPNPVDVTAPVTSEGLNPSKPGITTRAAKWLTQRDTDTAATDYGFGTGVYFPPIGECFSYVLGGIPGKHLQYGVTTGTVIIPLADLGSKPIPSSGYCIFKVRATRLPADNGSGIATTPQTGAALTVTVGQMVSGVFTPFLAAGGGDLIVTIPADSGTSDDFAVFLPVLGGNPINYQCAEQIIFEAWANWQPIFFNQMYGLGQFPYDSIYDFSFPKATHFAYALSFANDFAVERPGWAYPQPVAGDPALGIPSVVVFPLFRELYDDLVTLLGGLPGSDPGQPSGGAGGSGIGPQNIGGTGVGDSSGGGAGESGGGQI